jgi:hypothetical protein
MKRPAPKKPAMTKVKTPKLPKIKTMELNMGKMPKGKKK